MQPRRNLLVAEGNPDFLDLVVGHPGVFRIAFALALVVAEVLLVGLVDGPLRRAPMQRGDEIILARGDHVAGLLRRLGGGLATAGLLLEGGRGVGVFLDARANGDEIGVGQRAARRGQIDRARLVPIHAVGLNDVVELPALLGPASRHWAAMGGDDGRRDIRRRRCLRLRKQNGLFGGDRGSARHGGSGQRGRLQEIATVHCFLPRVGSCRRLSAALSAV